MRVRKLLLVVVALVILATLSACGGSEAPPDKAVAPKAPATQQPQDDSNAPADETLTVTVPKMQRVKDAAFPDTSGDDEDTLKNFAGIHLDGTGFPWQKEANVYLAGHRLGYPGYPSFLAFYDLDNVQVGDQILVTDANGKEYNYEVFQTLEVDPTELFVTEPLQGKNILTLQSCTLPDYARRLIVQAELKT
ncbi:MAG TPA: sortase [Rubrobacteraceae bacterium]|nr:sortase [Rubrobacteraceae bacterium]